MKAATGAGAGVAAMELITSSAMATASPAHSVMTGVRLMHSIKGLIPYGVCV